MRRIWTKPAIVVAFLMGTQSLVLAQSRQAGSLSGKLTDIHSAPLSGIGVTMRNDATGEETRTTTLGNGVFRVIGLDAGSYTLIAESPPLGRGRLEGIVVAARHETKMLFAIQLNPTLFAHPAVASQPTIETETAAIAESFAAEPLRGIALRGQSVWEASRVMPQTGAPPFGATLPALPLAQLGMLERALPPAPEKIPLDSVGFRGALHPPLVLATLGGEGEGSGGLNALSQFWSGGSGFAAGVAAMSVLRAALELAPPAKATAMADKPDPASALSVSTTTGEQLQALPASGRRWQDFVLDSSPAGNATESESPPRRAELQPVSPTLDGASRQLAFGNTGSGWRRSRGADVSEAAIREVQTVSGAVEAAGSRLHVESRRGENGFHGQMFLFDRENTWGARNPFTQWVQETAPATATSVPVFTPQAYTPPDHEIAWGFGLGSYIRRNRLFWFAALDRRQRNNPGLATVKHPDLFFAQPANDQMQVLSARLGLSSSNPVSAGLAKYSTVLEQLDGLLGPAQRTSTQWTGFARLDWKATERHSFALEATGARWNSPGGGLTRVEEPYGSHSFGASDATEQWLLARWEAFLTPNLLAVTQGSAGRTLQTSPPEIPSGFEQGLLQKPGAELPQIVVDSGYGFTIGNPSRFGSGSYPDERRYEAQEAVNWARRGLLIKVGLEFSHDHDATGLLRNQGGSYAYANVENFISDLLAYSNFGIAGSLNRVDQHNCDQTGKVWRDSAGTLRGVGYLPCYSSYSQTMGPANWWLSTNQWASYGTLQWQPNRSVVLSAGVRWDHQQLPPPIAELNNPDLPLAGKLPHLGNDFAPRVSVAMGSAESRWPVLRLGYGMYFGKAQNAMLLTALTHTGSPNGDLNFFMRPTDNLNAGGAPPFPYVLTGEPLNMVKPGAVEFASGFRNAQIHQAMAGVEETLPGHIQIQASAVASLGRRLPVSMDTNFDPNVNPQTITYAVVDAAGAGPIKSSTLKAPFYASWPSDVGAGAAGRLNPGYQQIVALTSRANSTYEAAAFRIDRYGRRGLTLRARYTYAHAMDWNPNESALVTGSDVLDPADFKQEYGTSDLDVRHSAAATVIWESPWKLRSQAGQIANGWMLSGVGNYRSGLPYTMRTAGALAKEFTAAGAAIVALGPGMNGSGGDNRVYGVGRNTFRYPQAWKADLRLAKRFQLRQMRQLELLAESFNLFNHRNVTELETVGYTIEPGNLEGGLPTLNFLTGLKADTTAFGQPLNVNATNFYRERQIQFGLRYRF